MTLLFTPKMDALAGLAPPPSFSENDVPTTNTTEQEIILVIVRYQIPNDD